MSHLRKHPWISLFLFSVLLLLSYMFLFPFPETKHYAADDLLYGREYAVELDHIPVIAQETSYTCNVASLAIIMNYLGDSVSEQSLRNTLGVQDRQDGMLPHVFLNYGNEALLPLSYSISLSNPTSQADILNTISQSLFNGLPVLIYYSTPDAWNPPAYNTHYSVVYGIDMKKEVVKLSNPYGFLEELSLEQFFACLSFESYEDEPFLHHMGRKVGYIKMNNIFTLQQVQ